MKTKTQRHPSPRGEGQGVRLIYRAIWILIITWFICMIIVALAGCTTPKKAIAKYKASSTFPADCADAFPPQITPGETITIPGPSYNCDSIQQAYNQYWESMLTATNGNMQALQDSITAMQARGIILPTKTIKCPPATHRTDTIENTARLEHYRRLLHQATTKAQADSAAMHRAHTTSLNKLHSQLSHASHKLQTRTKQRNIGWGILSLVGIYTFRHQIIGLLQGPIGSALSFLFGLFRRKK